jgi:hypothetical protein
MEGKRVFITAHLTIRNAKIIFRNFEGKEGKINPAGRRNFCVILQPDSADALLKDGWNVRWRDPKDPADDRIAYLPVAVSYANFPPKIYVITSQNKTLLSEDSVHILDWAEIQNIDLIIRPYNWEVRGKMGVKAYVKSMYVTVAEDEFEKKYRDVPDSALTSENDKEDPTPWE